MHIDLANFLSVFDGEFEFCVKSYPGILLLGAEKIRESVFVKNHVFCKGFLKDLVVKGRLRCWRSARKIDDFR